ncbi:hypothetical protein GCM10023185_28920 [Hymenobacter saemangeumensis]|uniref:Uncharacterized protein n=1 Tax=Hymenobacter saemangeumensis TaxID=1084522 RepID=A0ABP8IKN8_9BACT
MNHLLYYCLLAGGLLSSTPVAAREMSGRPRPSKSPRTHIDSLRRQAHSYTNYLTYALQLQPAQREAVAQCTEAYLLDLAAAPAGAPKEAIQHRYHQGLLRVLSPGQYSAFCWLQEREQVLAQP